MGLLTRPDVLHTCILPIKKMNGILLSLCHSDSTNPS